MYRQLMLREDSLKDQVIVVTGGGTGLGRSMVKCFLQLGAKVVITSRKKEVLEATARELEKETGGVVFPVPCDVTAYTEVEQLLQKTIDHFHGVDVLVNNAAGNFISPTERLSHRAFERVIDIVLKGSSHCTLAFGKYWIETKKERAKVLNIVTTYASTGSGYVVPSAISKAGVIALTRSLAVEWGKYGIRLNAIAPGPFPTKGAWDELFPPELKERVDFAKKNPRNRVGDHQELANLASYLVSDFADFINGEIVTIDGGEWLKGAGEFNFLDSVPDALWDEFEKRYKPKK